MGIDTEILVALGADLQPALRRLILEVKPDPEEDPLDALVVDLAKAAPQAGWVAARTYWKNADADALTESLRELLAPVLAQSDRAVLVHSSMDDAVALETFLPAPAEIGGDGATLASFSDLADGEPEPVEPDASAARWILAHAPGEMSSKPPRLPGVPAKPAKDAPCFFAWEVTPELELDEVERSLRRWWKRRDVPLVIAYHDDLDGAFVTSTAERGWRATPLRYAFSAAGLSR